jgi:hypothetical protein
LPKICGNTRLYHLTALLAASLEIACGGGSGSEEFREIRVHWLPGCGPGEGGGTARIDLQALGDFDPTPDTFEQFEADVVEVPSVFPLTTQAVSVRADDGFDEWNGAGTASGSGEFDIALWPEDDGCLFFRAEAGQYPEDGTGAAVGYAASTATVLISGGLGESATSAMTIDLGTGAAREVAAEDGPRTARSGATVTRFGVDLLIAGGVDPDSTSPLDSADVFRSSAGRFDPTRIELSRPRSRHAAVELRSGETLLVGGTDGSGALRTLEAISPESGEYRISGLPRLSGGRLDPVALRLSDDSVLIAGGVDAADEPVALLEWLDPAASAVTRSSTALAELAQPTRGRAFVAMPGGGALAAGGCALRLPSAAEADACELACGLGGGCASRDVFWITPSGDVLRLDGALDADASDARLVEGAGGRPWLIAGKPALPLVRVFDPFRARFEAPGTRPVPPSSAAAFQFVAIDPGLFVWLEEGNGPASVGGFRHGTRGPYTVSAIPLFLESNDGAAPDRPMEATTPGGGLPMSDPELRLILTDTTYDAVGLTLDIEQGAPPVVYLGERAYGEGDCAWPEPEAEGTATLTRTADGVRLEHGQGQRDCTPPKGRVTVSLRAPEKVVLTSIAVRRSTD